MSYGTNKLASIMKPASMMAALWEGRLPIMLMDTVMTTLAGMSTAPKIT
uniref:Uncharacterized protein n=1 Tax=Anguilla anguilla TaxID=7936 RepID=A0A0E9T7B8_ANGAN